MPQEKKKKLQIQAFHFDCQHPSIQRQHPQVGSCARILAWNCRSCCSGMCRPVPTAFRGHCWGQELYICSWPSQCQFMMFMVVINVKSMSLPIINSININMRTWLMQSIVTVVIQYENPCEMMQWQRLRTLLMWTIEPFKTRPVGWL